MTLAHEESRAQPRRRILIVEDERIIALDLSRALRTLGYAAVGIAVSSAEALQKTASLLPDLIACRYGGEEFVVVAPGASTVEASVLAERLRAAIEQLGKHAVGALAGVSASFGVASAEGDTASAVEVLRGADMALYAAKQSGRNRVVGA